MAERDGWENHHGPLFICSQQHGYGSFHGSTSALLSQTHLADADPDCVPQFGWKLALLPSNATSSCEPNSKCVTGASATKSTVVQLLVPACSSVKRTASKDMMRGFRSTGDKHLQVLGDRPSSDQYTHRSAPSLIPLDEAVAQTTVGAACTRRQKAVYADLSMRPRCARACL